MNYNNFIAKTRENQDFKKVCQDCSYLTSNEKKEWICDLKLDDNNKPLKCENQFKKCLEKKN